MYQFYSAPNSKLAKDNPEMHGLVRAIKDDLTIRDLRRILGIRFPATSLEIAAAMSKNWVIWKNNEDETALYYALQDYLHENAFLWRDREAVVIEYAEEEEDKYGYDSDDDEEYGYVSDEDDVYGYDGDDEEPFDEDDDLPDDDEDGVFDEEDDEFFDDEYDEEEETEEDSMIPFIKTLTYRKHDTQSRHGHVYDTGIHGTLLNPSDQDREEFLEALAKHGPYAFILEDRNVYNIACVDTMYYLFEGIWEGPAFADIVISLRREIDRKDYGHWEYNIANTISIMRDFDLSDEEIAEFLRGNERDYNCGYFFVNHYLKVNNDDKRYFYDPFEDLDD